MHPSKLHIVTCISNPIRYNSRYNLYRNFEKMVKDGGATLTTVEIAHGNRPFEVTEASDPNDIQLRTTSEIWHKENALNLGVQRLPANWEYMAWIDADVMFTRPDIFEETVHQLQHYDVVQMFAVAQDLLPNYRPYQLHKGFIYSYLNNLPTKTNYSNWHPGFAWAIRRSAFDAVGGLIDFAILGSADRHMAAGLVGKMDETIVPGLKGTSYAAKLNIWQTYALKYLHKNVGFVDGLLIHYWHGSKKNRKYTDRWKILTENKFNPDVDLKKDSQGLYQLTNRNIKLRNDIRTYFRERNEDSIDWDPSEIKL